MPLVPSAVEHTSVGPRSGARDYTVPAFHKVAATCTTGVWDHLIRLHCDTQTMVTHGLDRTLDRQFFWNLYFMEYHNGYFAISVHYFYLLPHLVFENRCSVLLVLKK